MTNPIPEAQLTDQTLESKRKKSQLKFSGIDMTQLNQSLSKGETDILNHEIGELSSSRIRKHLNHPRKSSMKKNTQPNLPILQLQESLFSKSKMPEADKLLKNDENQFISNYNEELAVKYILCCVELMRKDSLAEQDSPKLKLSQLYDSEIQIEDSERPKGELLFLREIIEEKDRVIASLREQLDQEKMGNQSQREVSLQLKMYQKTIDDLREHNNYLKGEINKSGAQSKPENKSLLTEDIRKLKKQLMEVVNERDIAYDRLMKEHLKLNSTIEKQKQEDTAHKSKLSIMASEFEATKKKNIYLKAELDKAKNQNKELNFIIQKMQEDTNKVNYKKELEAAKYELEKVKKLNQGKLNVSTNDQGKERLENIIDRLYSQLELLNKRNSDLQLQLDEGVHNQPSSNDSRFQIQIFLLGVEISRLNRVVAHQRSEQIRLAKLTNRSASSKQSNTEQLIISNEQLKEQLRQYQHYINQLEAKSNKESRDRVSLSGTIEGLGEDLNKKVKILRIENGRLDRALVQKVREVEGLKKEIATSRHNYPSKIST